MRRASRSIAFTSSSFWRNSLTAIWLSASEKIESFLLALGADCAGALGFAGVGEAMLGRDDLRRIVAIVVRIASCGARWFA